MTRRKWVLAAIPAAASVAAAGGAYLSHLIVIRVLFAMGAITYLSMAVAFVIEERRRAT